MPCEAPHRLIARGMSPEPVATSSTRAWRLPSSASCERVDGQSRAAKPGIQPADVTKIVAQFGTMPVGQIKKLLVVPASGNRYGRNDETLLQIGLCGQQITRAHQDAEPSAEDDDLILAGELGRAIRARILQLRQCRRDDASTS